jgi:hypothetical protein
MMNVGKCPETRGAAQRYIVSAYQAQGTVFHPQPKEKKKKRLEVATQPDSREKKESFSTF